MRFLARCVTGLLLTLSSSACVLTIGEPIYDTAGEPANTALPAEPPLKDERFPETVPLLIQAEKHIAAGRYAAAVTTLGHADKTYITERDALFKAKEAGDRPEVGSRAFITNRRAALSMTALVLAGEPWKALAVVAKYKVACMGMPRALYQKCNDASDKLEREFPGTIEYKRAGVMQVAAAAVIDSIVNTDSMNSIEVAIQHKAGPYVVFVYPETLGTNAKGATHLAVRGHSKTWMRDQCNKVGTVEVGSETFDVRRCREVPEATIPVSVQLAIDAADAPLLRSWKKGDAIGVMVDTKTTKHSGTSWNLGTGRAFFVGKVLPDHFQNGE